MSAEQAYLVNGRFDITLTPFDRGFAYGDGVFRTLSALGGSPQCWTRHFRRLEADCNVLGIVCPAEEVLRADIETLCHSQASPATDAVIKMVITRGESARGYAVPSLAQPTRVVIKTPFPFYPETSFNHGVSLHLCKTRLGRQQRLAGIKHLNRLENVLARMEWIDAHIMDGLMLDEEGNVIECTSSNIFARFGSVLVTPDLTQCGVAGITRDRIIAIAPTLGYSAEIRHLRLPELLEADEVIICNSLFGAMQVRNLVNVTWSLGVTASHLRELLQIDD